MKKILFLALLLLLFDISFSQNNAGDSLAVGRVCKIVLHNGFQADGKIASRNADTVILATEITDLKIPVKDIRFVLNSDVELSDYLEGDTIDTDSRKATYIKQDTTVECDVYLSGGKKLTDVQMVFENDSTLKVIRNTEFRLIGIRGIRKIVFKPSAPFGKGYLVGSAFGFVLGFVPLAFTKGGGHPDFSGPGVGLVVGLILSVPCGLIGGVASVLGSSDDVVIFDEGLYAAKIKKIKFMINKHKD